MGISRREFLESTAALGTLAAGAADAAPAMPKRILGKTGERVSILGFGGGSRWLMFKEEEGLVALNKALDAGITYVDTAESYGNGESQKRIGKVFKARGGKKGIFLASKIGAKGGKRDGSDFMRMLDESLKRLQLDQVDLLHVHALMGPDDLAKISAKGGAYEAAVKAKEQKLTRFIGVTCHAYPDVLKTALERHDFDCTQMALNAGLRTQVKDSKGCFETTALPVALHKKMGITAMKIFAQEALVGQAPVAKLIYYSMSLPVAAAVIGMPNMANLEENIQLAKAFKPLPADEMKSLSGELSSKNKVALERFFCHHIDA
jgi:predicted aldo/keto reductase-like oxidoreductase